jgi:DNA-binding CsgD family transcriptional regulator
MTRLSASDLKGVLSFAEQAQADERPTPFTRELLDRLATLVGCEQAAFVEVDHPQRILHERITSYGPDRIGNHMPDELWTCARTVELNRHKLASGAGPVVLSDVFHRRLRHAPDFNANLREVGAVDEIHVDLDPPRQWKAEVAVYRSRDFGPRERLILQLARPHLAAAYRTAVLRRRLAVDPQTLERLTSREREVMDGVAEGLSNREIARALVVEPSTVRKHLEHIYAKLGVGSRTAALAKLRVH